MVGRRSLAFAAELTLEQTPHGFSRAFVLCSLTFLSAGFPSVLEVRLDQRVDVMMEAGLLEELQNFHQQYNKEKVADKR